MLLIAADQPGLDALPYVVAMLGIDMFAVPLALPCLVYTILDLRRGDANVNRAALWLVLAGNAVTLLVPAAATLVAVSE